MIQHAKVAPPEWDAWAIWKGSFGGSLIPQVGLVASAGLGSLLGMRHALEPDHLAAVSTLLTGERSSAKAAWLGACWGLGHTLTLLTAGVILVVLRAEMPAFAAEAFECCVVLMLVGFGVRAIYQGAGRGSTGSTHSHAEPGRLGPVRIGQWTLARPLLMGAVHGLAGSGAHRAVARTVSLAVGGVSTVLGLFWGYPLIERLF